MRCVARDGLGSLTLIHTIMSCLRCVLPSIGNSACLFMSMVLIVAYVVGVVDGDR
jgi:hypothetical protein